MLFLHSHQPDPIPVFRKLTSGKAVPHILDVETCVCQDFADGFPGVIVKPIPVYLNLLAANQDILVQPYIFFRVVKTLFKDQVLFGIPEPSPADIPAVLKPRFHPKRSCGDVENKRPALS